MIDLDADIARMLAVYRNRKRLGFSYYQLPGRSGRLAVDPKLERERATARQRAMRARRRAASAEPGA